MELKILNEEFNSQCSNTILIQDKDASIFNFKKVVKLPISKNQMKKLKKEEEWKKKKEFNKNKIKEKDKIKREKKREQREKDHLNYKEEMKEEFLLKVNPPRAEIKKEFLKKIENGITLIIDCKFEDKMKEKEIKSLIKQITMCYSANKKSENPFNLILFDVGKLLKKQLIQNNCQNWTGFNYFCEGEYIDLVDFIDKYKNYSSLYIKEKTIYNKNTIYLTGDSENTLKEPAKDCIYIIGGIIDRNKHRNLTLEKLLQF